MLLANRMARLFVVAYLVLLHVFVVAMLYIWSAGGGSSAEIDIAALAPLMAPSAQVRPQACMEAGLPSRQPGVSPDLYPDVAVSRGFEGRQFAEPAVRRGMAWDESISFCAAAIP